MAKNELEHLPTADLIPYARNARLHSDAQIAKIAGSLMEFGFCNPVLIDSQDGIIAGHGRVLAALKLGMETVPCLRLDHLSDIQRRAYILADNRLALDASWDEAMLGLELSALEMDGFDLDLVGFDAGELQNLLSGVSVSPLDDMPELPIGDREPFQQMTFTLHDSQAEIVSHAISIAKDMGEFEDSPNENGNGNALARICEMFISAHA